MRIECLYGRQECMFVKKGTCPREGQCLLAGELKAKSKKRQKEEEGGGEDLQYGNTRDVSSECTESAGLAVHY
jgi:hypothetical protein